MRLHERTIPVQGVAAEIKSAFWESLRGKDITYVELLQVLNEIEDSCLKYMLRDERHGDTSKKADEV